MNPKPPSAGPKSQRAAGSGTASGALIEVAEAIARAVNGFEPGPGKPAANFMIPSLPGSTQFWSLRASDLAKRCRPKTRRSQRLGWPMIRL